MKTPGNRGLFVCAPKLNPHIDELQRQCFLFMPPASHVSVVGNYLPRRRFTRDVDFLEEHLNAKDTKDSKGEIVRSRPFVSFVLECSRRKTRSRCIYLPRRNEIIVPRAPTTAKAKISRPIGIRLVACTSAKVGTARGAGGVKVGS